MLQHIFILLFWFALKKPKQTCLQFSVSEHILCINNNDPIFTFLSRKVFPPSPWQKSKKVNMNLTEI